MGASTASQPRIDGWSLIERRWEQAHDRSRTARTAAEFSAVGEACGEILWLVLQNLYAEHGNLKLRLDNSLRDLLDTYISQVLTGHSVDVVRSSLADAASKLHAGTTDARTAGICLAATKTVVDYLSITSGRRQQSRETIKDLCERFLQENTDVGISHSYTVQRLATSPIGKRVASELTVEDVVDHVRHRREEGVGGATVTQDVTYLRGVVAAAGLPTDAIDHAKRSLRKNGLIGQSTPRNRRPTREELQSLVTYFEEAQEKPKVKIPMRDIMEFALWSARRISEICDLRWDDLDKNMQNCKVRITDARHAVREVEFPLLGKARDIVMRQRPKAGSPYIFPYNPKSAGAAYTRAKKALGINNLKFQDLRREAAIRLYEAGHSVEQIAKVTGRIDLNTLLRDIAPANASAAPRQENRATNG